MKDIHYFLLLLISKTESFRGIYGLVQVLDRLGIREEVAPKLIYLVNEGFLEEFEKEDKTITYYTTNKSEYLLKNLDFDKVFDGLSRNVSNKGFLSQLKAKLVT